MPNQDAAEDATAASPGHASRLRQAAASKLLRRHGSVSAVWRAAHRAAPASHASGGSKRRQAGVTAHALLELLHVEGMDCASETLSAAIAPFLTPGAASLSMRGLASFLAADEAGARGTAADVGLESAAGLSVDRPALARVVSGGARQATSFEAASPGTAAGGTPSRGRAEGPPGDAAAGRKRADDGQWHVALRQLADAVATASRGARHVFAACDRNSAGRVSGADLVARMTRFGCSLDPAAADDLVARFDRSGDGTLSMSEFVSMLATAA
ncbi:hypothetical protein FNF29_08106 [Cafeteria roenbergensis]|uniref:EF-hand domain-containing protein n=1 Tax=Cafeteria roenbergensis TaxID=33653 RepID=A0A5A8C011_CAFRO|nr:hypothetical protein FNF29_08106 [Cafeteria roenbergensis]KAA0172440.1 hypothetical protein FNF28_00123 [Cafeteria roenbergensis]|eukprot:KAA0146333.1 hypothetical protein FNF29_08106 [Cafeteria roenbergensis]